jgi:hypothetical protein
MTSYRKLVFVPTDALIIGELLTRDGSTAHDFKNFLCRLAATTFYADRKRTSPRLPPC